MSESSLARFIEKLRTDPALKERVLQAEQAAAANIRREADAIAAIAAEAGFDISEWAKRPSAGSVDPLEDEKASCADLTCCLVGTSTTW